MSTDDYGQSVFDVSAGGITRSSLENPATNLGDFDLEEDGGSSDSGVRVTAETALKYAPVWQALSVLSGDVAQLPLNVYKRLDPRGKERDTEHPAHRLFHLRANDELCPFTWKQTTMVQALLRGNSYSYIERRGSGRPVNLWLLDPARTTPVRAGGKLQYVTMNNDNLPETLDPFEVFHLRGMGDDGLAGRSVVSLARDSFGMGMGAERYATRFYKNDAKPGVVLEFPNAVDGPVAKNILHHWEQRHGGSRNAGRPGFLDRGGKVNMFGMSNKDSQHIESRQHQRTEVAGWFNLPPHKVGDLSRATFANIEQQSLDYVTYSLMQWLVRMQEECNAKLLTSAEQESGSHFFEFLTAALLRGDIKSRYEAYAIGRVNGWLSADDVRGFENQNPLPDNAGEIYLQPLNMQEAGETLSDDTPADDARHAHAAMLEDALRRQCRRLTDSAKRAAKKPDAWCDWLDGKLMAQHSGGILDQLEHPCRAAATVGLSHRAMDLTDTLFVEYRKALLDAADGDPELFTNRVDSTLARLERDLPASLLSGGKDDGET